MCGLAGFIPLKGNINSVDMHSIGSKMANAILSRGPDDSGVWVEQNLRIAMSFRRLAILDLTPAGHQPMQSNSGRYYICFNGEIYNHLDLRKDLSPDIKWKGYSDTETILAVIENIGIEEALSKFVGMFAFALWDQKKERLTLARDRMGEKPMYYGFNEGAFIFGSELKALKQHPDFSNEISRLALSNFLKYNYVPAPQSIYKNIYKLSPGSFIHIDSSSLNKKQLEPQRYWSFSCIAHQNQKNLIKDRSAP